MTERGFRAPQALLSRRLAPATRRARPYGRNSGSHRSLRNDVPRFPATHALRVALQHLELGYCLPDPAEHTGNLASDVDPLLGLLPSGVRRTLLPHRQPRESASDRSLSRYEATQPTFSSSSTLDRYTANASSSFSGSFSRRSPSPSWQRHAAGRKRRKPLGRIALGRNSPGVLVRRTAVPSRLPNTPAGPCSSISVWGPAEAAA
jgi:hypothetical protein